MDPALSHAARSLSMSLEPVAGQVYFSPECHRSYEALGFGPSPAELGGVAMPEMESYFTSRGSVMGQVPGDVVAAAFGVFKPEVVIPSVAAGWVRTDAATIEQARTDGGVGQLRRILGDEPEGLDRAVELLTRATRDLTPYGRPLFAGLRSQQMPDSPLGEMWRRADMAREYRGDVHVATWTSAGLDACEIGLLTELYWGLGLRTYSRTRGWSTDDFDAAEARLVDRGLVHDGAFTDEGRAFREQIERTTDAACAPIIDPLGDDIDDLVEILGTWASAIRDAKGYPASGPMDLAAAASRR